MGKKSKRPNRSTTSSPSKNTDTTCTSQQQPQPQPQSQSQLLPPQNNTTSTNNPYPQSDGPSEEDLSTLQTDSPSLQRKLDQLRTFAQKNDVQNFVEQFVPLDLTRDEKAQFLHDLTEAPEAEGQWTNLVQEITVLAAGVGVTKIEGDQISNAVFYFEHPVLKGCDREVSFICVGGEWRAEG
mmetsp:Transcript_11189/g.16940  ORF Transcript_11189/g.16940 Transcript_11189/m.16940 type:complete len:182 (+) Transcript_11189:207-752(+)